MLSIEINLKNQLLRNNSFNQMVCQFVNLKKMENNMKFILIVIENIVDIPF